MKDSSTESVVEIEQLTKRFGEFVALDNLSLTLNKGDILGFIGPNGAGKTTTIRILVGLTKPTSGSARIAGADCTRESRRVRSLVGYMPDKFGSYDNMRVREYLDFFGAAFGIPRRKRQSKIDEVLETTNAKWMQDRFVESLSHGMQQRVGIARTLLHDPEVLILDEPANGLDPQARIEMREILLQLAEQGRTLIVTSHILPELARICDRIAIMAQGQLKAFGSLKEVTQKLSQKKTFELQYLSADQLDSAADCLNRAIPDDNEISVSPTESIVRFRTSANEQKLASVLNQLAQDTSGLTQFREIAGDLEEAFINVTQTEQQDQTQNTTDAVSESNS